LDPVQARAAALPNRRSLLLLGQAGTGKTTVALARLARLEHHGRVFRRRLRTAYLVPTASLADQVRERMGGLDADVAVVDAWLSQRARCQVPDLPARDSVDATAGIVGFKRHPAVREVLQEVAGLNEEVRWESLLELWGDDGLLRDIVEASEGDLSGPMAASVSRHAQVQFSEPTDAVTFDGRPVDEGTPMGDAGSMDVEDAAVVLALLAQCGGVRDAGYDHIVVDEAQELAPLELAAIGAALKPQGGLTLVGDADQQIDPTAWFSGWTQACLHLGLRAPARVELRTSHRCPAALLAAVYALRTSGRLGGVEGVVQIAHFQNREAERRALVDALREVPSGRTVVLVAADAERAARLHRSIRAETGARLARTQRPSGAVEVRAIEHVRGLEFDHVFIPGADAEAYPETPRSRGALVVAATRARRTVWVGVPGVPSPLVA
jgi:superfamily I DNA/RNA helicase